MDIAGPSPGGRPLRLRREMVSFRAVDGCEETELHVVMDQR
jgi:hypothetical protein